MNFASLLLSPGFFLKAAEKMRGSQNLHLMKGLTSALEKKSYKNVEKNANKILKMCLFLHRKKMFILDFECLIKIVLMKKRVVF